MPSSEYKIAWREFESILNSLAEDPKLFSLFLEDLLSPEERRAIALRWQIVKLLSRGSSQREISQKLGVAIATITRGSRLLLNQDSAVSKIFSMTIQNNKPLGRTASWRKQLKSKKA